MKSWYVYGTSPLNSLSDLNFWNSFISDDQKNILEIYHKLV